MTTNENLPPAGQLVLCWLLVYKEQRATEAEVKEGLPELNDPGSRETTHFGKALALLEQRQLCRREKNPGEIKDRIDKVKEKFPEQDKQGNILLFNAFSS